MNAQASTRFFSDHTALQYFLSTNNYWAYYRKRLPKLLLQAVRPGRGAPGAVNVLDIGCGPGDLSIPIFEKLARHFRVLVTAFDPSPDAVNAYCAAYKTSPRRSVLLNLTVDSFQSFPETNTFDLVLAAHSLYEPFETSIDHGLMASEVCRKVRALSRQDGVICVIMASDDSMVYEFKRDAYGVLREPFHFMMTGELFDEYMSNTGISLERQIADTYMDVSDFFTSEESSWKLNMWLSYLLRLDVGSCSADVRAALMAMVRDRALRFAVLPELLKSGYQDCPAPIGRPTNDSRILFHKELVLISRI